MKLRVFHLLVSSTIFLSCFCYGQKPPADKQSARIINGEQVPISKYLFAASLLRRERHTCGGSILSHYFILTAAHCLVNKENVEWPDRDFSVSVGNQFWDDGQRYKVDKKIIHSKYLKKNKVFDLALVRTFTKVKMGPSVSLVRLNPVSINDKIHNISATVLGWGYKDDEGELVARPTGHVHHVKLFVIPWDVCRKFFGSVIKRTQLCVSSLDNRGSCNGDSGGPLITDVHEKVMQIGLVSFGGNCNNSVPEVYTRISSFYSWIRNKMKDHKFD